MDFFSVAEKPRCFFALFLSLILLLKVSVFTKPNTKNKRILKITITAEHAIKVKNIPSMGKSRFSSIFPKIAVGKIKIAARRENFK